MKGCNTILMNQATVVDAMQYYLTNVLLKPAMKVTAVKPYDDDGFSEGFRVEIEEFKREVGGAG